MRNGPGVGWGFENATFLGHEVKVYPGSIPSTPHYDDGWVFALISQCSVFYDVGCNLGFFSLMACLDSPNRKVIVADANPKALALTAANLFANGISRQVQFVASFISNEHDEEIDFFTVQLGAAGSRYRSHAKTASLRNSSIKVRTTTIDNIVKDLDIRPDFVKMDIEGAEADALEGARVLASSHQTRFLVEMHSRQEMSMMANGGRVLNWCDRSGSISPLRWQKSGRR